MRIFKFLYKKVKSKITINIFDYKGLMPSKAQNPDKNF